MDKKMNILITVFFVYQAFEVCQAFLSEPVNRSVNFLAFGDWGGLSFHPFTTPVQTSVADQMSIVAGREKASFVVALGDNFYLFGVENVDDPRFQTTFESVYHSSSLHVPWYVVAGNHDYYGNVSAQIAYTKRSNRWKFPDYYHKVSETIPGGKTLDIVLIDTIQLCGNVFALGVQPAGPADKKAAEAQWAWIEQTLNKSTADYLLVGGHYPVQSVAEHGPTDCLTHRLEPLLYRYNVSAYMAGHDHQLQHIQMNKEGQTMDYFNVGAGNFVDKSQAHISSIPPENLKFFFADLMYFGGFSFFEVTDTEMKIRFIDGVGNVRHEHVIKPRE
ncbi:tartrate-resistant acid phosphatase type 5-like isoform X2 [Ruditapes philippinarum]|uniref:tartrate-resistant acid phosphatase type 5-like isoform X2 n=1 Tax=Ruditapes philippinarum TaxID=129788 RepID=UPI00295B655A|nr:tartrate-resistant acid phosphatase type 5-like isoform X2 [Ruditapes philippinarum]